MPAAAGGKALTLEQAFTSTHMILGELQSPASLQMLSSVPDTGDTLTKWQQVNGLLVSATLRVLPQVGYSADGQGLQAYTMSFAECARTNSPEASGKLQELNTAKWRVLLEHAFGCEPAPPMTLAKARELAIDIVDAMQDPALLKQVDESRTGLASRLPEAERQHMVARALVSVQAEAVLRHGFEGHAGYAQAQVCLMEHAGDPVVTASIAAATSALYARAGIDLQAALQQAASSM